MVFPPYKLTEAGRVLLAKALGGAEIEISKIEVGDGAYPDYPNTTPDDLINRIMGLPISNMERTDSIFKIFTILETGSVPAPFHLREMGVYAIDPDLGEVMISYSNNGANATLIDPKTSLTTQYILNMQSWNVENVMVNISNAGFATSDELQQIRQEVDALIGKQLWLPAHNFNTATPKQQELTDYALSITDGKVVLNSTVIKNLHDGTMWIFNETIQTWVDFGQAEVTTATNDSLGVVKGSTEAGGVDVAADGTMTVIGVPLLDEDGRMPEEIVTDIMAKLKPKPGHIRQTLLGEDLMPWEVLMDGQVVENRVLVSSLFPNMVIPLDITNAAAFTFALLNEQGSEIITSLANETGNPVLSTVNTLQARHLDGTFKEFRSANVGAVALLDNGRMLLRQPAAQTHNQSTLFFSDNYGKSTISVPGLGANQGAGVVNFIKIEDGIFAFNHFTNANNVRVFHQNGDEIGVLGPLDESLVRFCRLARFTVSFSNAATRTIRFYREGNFKVFSVSQSIANIGTNATTGIVSGFDIQTNGVGLVATQATTSHAGWLYWVENLDATTNAPVTTNLGFWHPPVNTPVYVVALKGSNRFAIFRTDGMAIVESMQTTMPTVGSLTPTSIVGTMPSTITGLYTHYTDNDKTIITNNEAVLVLDSIGQIVSSTNIGDITGVMPMQSLNRLLVTGTCGVMLLDLTNGSIIHHVTNRGGITFSSLITSTPAPVPDKLMFLGTEDGSFKGLIYEKDTDNLIVGMQSGLPATGVVAARGDRFFAFGNGVGNMLSTDDTKARMPKREGGVLTVD